MGRVWAARSAKFFAFVALLVGLYALAGALSRRLESPTVSPDHIPAATPTTVTFTARITRSSYVPNSANVVRLRQGSKDYTVLGAMHDDGADGDLVAGDKTFTLSTTVLEPDPGLAKFAISALFVGDRKPIVSSAAVLRVTVDSGTTPVIGEVTITPASTPAGVAVISTVTAMIDNGALLPTAVELHKLDASGALLASIANLHDDGEDGDAVAADKIYSARTTILENAVGNSAYRVTATFPGFQPVLSQPLNVSITGTAIGIAIVTPATGAYLNTPVITVSGTVGDPAAQVTINGIATPVSGTNFSTSVPLNEGPNTVTAVASNSTGATTTNSVLVTLDTTPPKVQIYAPTADSSTKSGTVTVSGLVNDIVVGTVNPLQATVVVNGVTAEVVNRSFAARDVPLAAGINHIQAVATDRAGNRATNTVDLTRLGPNQAGLAVQSGNNQSGPAKGSLPTPLVAKLTDGNGVPVANAPVVFRVIAQDGAVSPPGAVGTGLAATAVNTDAQGLAQVFLTLGSRAGVGNNLVEASSAGLAATALFSASGTAGSANLVVIDSGNNQIGVVGQPLPRPLIAIVTDGNNNRLANVPVNFLVKSGGGDFGGQPSLQATSDSDGRIAATLTLGPNEGVSNNLIEVNFPNSTVFAAAFTATGLVPGPADQTSISGVVLDNSNNPIPGVTMRLLQITQGNRSNIPQEVATPVRADAQGQFVMQPVPVGVFKLMADGGTAERTGTWPTLEYDMITVPGRNNTVGMPMYLPELRPNNRLCVSDTAGGTLTIPEAPGFALTIAAGSATFPGGSRTGCVSVTPVNMDKVPMAPGFGQQPRFIVTIQPVGTHFNPPAQLTIPNLDGLAPRAVTEMYSYDHDLASFVAIGSATVSEDGSTITSDAGSGVIKAGWHCGGDPNANGTVADCPDCKSCQGNQCLADNSRAAPQASPMDCKEQYCGGGRILSRNKDTELPTEVCKECKNGSPQNVADYMKPRGNPPKCDVCKMGVTSTLPPHTGMYEELAKCPDSSTQDDAVLHMIDGCSNSPDDLESWDNLPFAINYNLYVTNPIWGTVLGTISNAAAAGQTLACNVHDVCYQTCGSNKGSCDAALGNTITASCDIGYPQPCARADQTECVEYEEEYNSCREIGPVYTSGVNTSFGLSAWQERQYQYCFCCKP